MLKKLLEELSMHDMVAKHIKIKAEGTTKTSLENLGKILSAGFSLERATLHFDKEKSECRLHTEWLMVTKDFHDVFFVHEFLGFNAGYGGEGPRGLAEFCKKVGATDWDIDKISSLKSGTYSVFK